MNPLLEFFINNKQSIIFFILGIIVSYIFYRLGIKGSKPIYYSYDSTIIDKQNQLIPNEFRILYGDNELNKLVRTNVYFWNGGTKPIRSGDLTENDKLRIELNKELKIYSYNIAKYTDKSKGVYINDPIDKIEDNVINLQLDYLEPKNGIRIEILHDKEISDAKICGKVIGVTGGIRNSSSLVKTKLNSIMEFIYALLIYFSLFMTSLFILFLFSYIPKTYGDLWVLFGLFVIVITHSAVAPTLYRNLYKSKKYYYKLDEKE